MSVSAGQANAFDMASYPCAICGSTRSRDVMQKSGVRITKVFHVVACDECGHVYVNPRVADGALGSLYDAAYYRGEGFDRTIDYAGSASKYKRAEVAAVAATVEATRGTLANVRWLDFGCGAGYLLEALIERGVAAVGFDDSEIAVAHCVAKGLPVVTRGEVDAAAGSFDVISAVEVIEHVPDPRQFLRHLVSLLRPGGVAYVQTGNWNVVRRLPGTPYVMPEGHIHYFTPLELRRLFSEVGLVCAATFNRSWFPWRDLSPALRRFVPIELYELLATTVSRLAPDYGPFPVGILVRPSTHQRPFE